MRGDPDITTEEVVLQEPTAVLEKQDTEKLRGVGSDDSSDNVAGLDQGDFLKGHDEQLDEDHVIVTGADAANYLLSIRDDGDPALTVRSMVLATVVAAFQAAMNQIYSFKPTSVTISGSFIVLIIWFLGRGWALLLPRGDRLEAKWRANGGSGRRPWWISLAVLFNPREFGLKEHAVAAITASSASHGVSGIQVFTVQNLYYNDQVSATTVILSTLSIGLYGYGLTGLLRPITVWAPESVYWTNIPVVKILQSLHWDDVKNSKPLRVFWYCFAGMGVYEWFPAYIFPWLNSVSIPCLASMHATGNKAHILRNVFGGSLSNEGLGILNFSFDWQYITSSSTSMPLKLQANFAVGLVICWIAMLAVYYGNAWGALSQPFMSTSLKTAAGGSYSSTSVFVNGILDEEKLASYGLPHLTGTYTWAMLVGNAAIGAVIAHCILFWGKDILLTIKRLRKGEFEDRHHAVMATNYKEASWMWYAGMLVISFVLGLVVVITQNLTFPVYGYIIALVVGSIVAPFSTILYARFGNGIATNALMKMIAGAIHPGRPLANLYFTGWSHSAVMQSIYLSGDLKMGEYLKIPPRTMLLTQVWGTVFGAFINYAVMISIVNNHRDILVDSNGSSTWSGQSYQSLNTQATAWALAKYLYVAGKPYVAVPIGLAIGFGLVVIHRVVVRFVPRIGRLNLSDINLPTLLMYSGWLGYNQTQSCVVISQLLAGFFVQYYLRNYRPRIFKDYQYLVTAAFDGASLFVLFILSFAVLGAGGLEKPFPFWWGNPNTDLSGVYVDHCPGGS